MQTFNNTRFYSIQAAANALGGFLEEPGHRLIPTLAPVSLPAVGGLSTARSEAFVVDELVRVASAYTRVSGLQHTDGSVSILVTSVVQNVNILDVVEAERIVAQLSIFLPGDDGPLRVSTAGSRFEGLRLAGHLRRPQLNERLLQLESQQSGGALGLTAANVAEIGDTQASRVADGFQGLQGSAWAQRRSAWMKGGRAAQQSRGSVICSLVDGFADAGPKSCGHVVDIPGFGRFIFAELMVTQDSVQLVSIRAELGCPVKGKVTVNCGGGGGIRDT